MRPTSRPALPRAYPLQGFPKGIGPNGYGYTVIRNTRGGNLDEVHVFSPTFVLDSRLGLEVHPFGLVYPGNANFDLSTLGISGSYPYASFPGVSFNNGGYASLAPGAGGQISTSTVGSLNEIATKTVNTHSIRFGFEGNILRYNQQNPESGFWQQPRSTPGFTFDNRFTQQNVTTTSVGADPNSGDALADMLLGAFSSDSYTINPSYALQQIYIAPWIQDDWRVTSKTHHQSRSALGSRVALHRALQQTGDHLLHHLRQPAAVICHGSSVVWRLAVHQQ